MIIAAGLLNAHEIVIEYADVDGDQVESPSTAFTIIGAFGIGDQNQYN